MMMLATVMSLAGLAFGAAVPGAAASDAALEPRKADTVTTNFVEMERVPVAATRVEESSPKYPMSLHKNVNNVADSWLVSTDNNVTAVVSSVNTTLKPTFTLLSSYIIPIKIANQELQVIVDTASSDTWVVQSNFQCMSGDEPMLSAICQYGPTFNGTFKYGTVPGTANFTFQTLDGSFIGGQAGYDDITVAGVTVKKQELLLASVSYNPEESRVFSGVLGLNYPLKTRVYTSTSPDENFSGSKTHRKYDPVFTSMHKQGLVAPLFSMAMNKKAGKGWLAFGGLPPVDHGADFAKTPIRMVEVGSNEASRTENSFYTIIPDGFTYGNMDTKNFTYTNPTWTSPFNDTNKSQFPVIIDSGHTYALLPPDIVLPYVKQFSPPVGRFDRRYWAPCNSVVPDFGVKIGGKTILLSKDDLLQQDSRSERDYRGSQITVCLIGLMDTSASGPYVLGDVFLNNVVSVFDVGAGEMRFYPRK